MSGLPYALSRYVCVAAIASVLLAGTIFRPSAFAAGTLEAMVSAANPDAATATIDAGKEKGVEVGDRFYVFGIESFVVLPFSGGRRLLERKEAVATLVIERVDRDQASGVIRLTKPEYKKLLTTGCLARRIESNLGVNRPPSIAGLKLSSTNIYRGGVYTATIEYSDPNGDVPLFGWEATNAVCNSPSTHIPRNTIYIPMNTSADKISIKVTADDFGENGRTTATYDFPFMQLTGEQYRDSQFVDYRRYSESVLGERFSLDDVGSLADGRIALLDFRRQRAIFIFDERMRLVRKVDGQNKAINFTTVGSNIFLLERQGVTVLNSSGEKLSGFFYDNADLTSYVAEPTSLAVRSNGEVIVIDGKSKQLKVFDSAGQYRSAFGVAGQGVGGFLQPVAVVEDKFSTTYVLDAQRKDIQLFNKDFTSSAKAIAVSEVDLPTDMDYDANSHSLSILGARGTVLVVSLDDTTKRKTYEFAGGTSRCFDRTPADVYFVATDFDAGPILQRYIPGKGRSLYSDDNFAGITTFDADLEGNLYTVSKNFEQGLVRILDRDGWLTGSLVNRGSDDKSVRDATKMRVSPTGGVVFVLDGDARVNQYSPNGVYVRTYTFEEASDIAVDYAGMLYVLTSRLGEVYRCSEGNKQQLFRSEDRGTSRKYMYLDVSPDGKTIYIGDVRNNIVLRRSGAGYPETELVQAGPFKKLIGLRCNAQGVVFILDGSRGAVNAFLSTETALAQGAMTPVDNAQTFAVNGMGELAVQTKTEIRILRPSILNYEK
ncbi:MAG: hypothetical protein WC712_00050 [Candidatus Brocadiia bacterium]